MRASGAKIVTLLLLAAVAAGLGYAIFRKLESASEDAAAVPGQKAPAPVEVAAIERGEMVLQRTFSGALEATSEFVVSAKVSGRVEQVRVDLSDPVRRGEVVVVLEDDELEQAVHQAEANLAVARANAAEAGSALDTARRELERSEQLRDEGVASESQLDTARAEKLALEARLAVAQAQISRAESALEAARIRLGYARVIADWTGGDEERLVAERFVDEGDTVSPNQALLSIVELDPVTGVLQVPERDYARLRAGQDVRLTAQTFPGEVFEGRITRIAPVFRASTRQARVEFRIANPEQRLKPGMFVRATVEMERAAEVTIVPAAALTERGGQAGVFVVADGGRSVSWRPVTLGIESEGRVQVEGDGLRGRVVTLGHQLVDDGSAIVIPDEAAAEEGPPHGGAGEAPL